jgi:hypothetical protein
MRPLALLEGGRKDKQAGVKIDKNRLNAGASLCRGNREDASGSLTRPSSWETLMYSILGTNQLAIRKARLSDGGIFNGLQPSKMAAHPCAAGSA